MKFKAIILACAMVACMAGAAFAAQPLAISQTRVDFGNMKEGPAAEKTVTLTNISGKLVTIKNVTTS